MPPQFCNDTRMKITMTDSESGIPLAGAVVTLVFEEPTEDCDCSQGEQ